MISASISPNCLFIKQLNRRTKLFGNNQIFIYIFSYILLPSLPLSSCSSLMPLLLLKIHHIIKTRQRKVTARALFVFLFISVAYLSFSIFHFRHVFTVQLKHQTAVVPVQRWGRVRVRVSRGQSYAYPYKCNPHTAMHKTIAILTGPLVGQETASPEGGSREGSLGVGDAVINCCPAGIQWRCSFRICISCEMVRTNNPTLGGV